MPGRKRFFPLMSSLSQYLSPGLTHHIYHYGSFAVGERHIGQGGVLMPALIKRLRAPLTCNNQLTCLKRHLFKNTCFLVCEYENVFVMWCVFISVFVWRFVCPNLIFQNSIWYALVEYLDEGRSNLPEKNQISGQIYRRPSSNLKYLQKTLIKSTIFTDNPH